MDQQDDLSVMFPAVVRVTVGGREVDVTPLTLGELPVLLGLLHQAGRGLSPDALNPLALLVEQPQLALDLVAVLTRQDAAWLVTLALDDAAALLVAAIEVNQSFFVRNGRALVAAVEKATAAAGRLPLPG